MSKNIILNSLIFSFYKIWKRKTMFLLLVLFQIVFFSLLTVISLTSLIPIVDTIRETSEYIATQNLDEVSATQDILDQKDFFGDDPAMIGRNLNFIVDNFRNFLIYLLIFLSLSLALSWSLTSKLVKNLNFKNFGKKFLSTLVISGIYLILIFIFLYLVLNITFEGAAEFGTGLISKYLTFLVFTFVMLYFLFISLALIHKNNLNNILEKTLIVGLKKAHYVFFSYIIVLLFILTSMVATFYYVDRNFVIHSISLILFIFSLIFSRIFLVNVVNKLA